MANSLISMIKGDSTLINNTEVLDGQVLFNTDEKTILLDDDNTRTKYCGADKSNKNLAPIENGNTATRGYAAGSYVVWKEQLYKVLTQINSGTAFVVGTNIALDTVGAELTQIKSDLIKYHRRVAYYNNRTKTYAKCLEEIANQLDALQLNDEQIANVCLEVGSSTGSFNLARLTRHNKANGYYNFEFMDASGTIVTVYSAHKTSSGIANVATEITCATGVSNNISSAVVAQEWRVYV